MIKKILITDDQRELVEAMKARFFQVGFFVHEFVCTLEEFEVLESTSLVEELINREECFLSLVI